MLSINNLFRKLIPCFLFFVCMIGYSETYELSRSNNSYSEHSAKGGSGVSTWSNTYQIDVPDGFVANVKLVKTSQKGANIDDYGVVIKINGSKVSGALFDRDFRFSSSGNLQILAVGSPELYSKIPIYSGQYIIGWEPVYAKTYYYRVFYNIGVTYVSTGGSNNSGSVYTVSFNANGGSVSPSSKTVSKGSSVGALPTPTRSGYTFDGWYTSASGGTKISSTTAINGDVTYYAHWAAISSKPDLSPYTPGGWASSMVLSNISGVQSTTKTSFGDNDNIYLSWAITVSRESVSSTFYVTLYVDDVAIKKWAVDSLDLGKYISLKNYNMGKLTVGNHSIRLEVDSGENIGESSENNNVISRTITINPPVIYSVNFDANGGFASCNELLVKRGSEVGELPTATMEGWIFDGWYTAKSGGVKISSSTVITGNVTYFARWCCKVFFNANGGTVPIDSMMLVKGDKLGTLPIAARNGYTFKGWYTSVMVKTSGLTVVIEDSKVSKSTVVSPNEDGDMVLYAGWSLISGAFDLKFGKPSGRGWPQGFFLTTEKDSNIRMASLPESSTIYRNSFIYNAGTEIMDIGFYIEHAICDTNGIVLRSFCEYDSSVYEPNRGYVRANKCWDEGFASLNPGNYIYKCVIDSKYNIPEIGARTNNVFEYPFVIVHDGQKVEFDPNGGIVDEEARYVTKNSEIGNLPVPLRDGYLFDGWFTSPSGGTMISPSVVVKGPTTYYAHWIALHTVLFNANGGSVWPTEKTVANGTAIGKLPVPEKIGYRFDGWYSSINNEKLVDTTIVDGNLTLIARWALPMVEVSCDSESKGSVVGAKTAKIGTKVILKAIANKGYVFSHWEGPLGDVADSRSPSIAYVVGDEDVRFTAHFIPVADDIAAISFKMANEYVTGDVIASVAVNVSGCTSLPTVKVTGLPAGLKFTAKDVLKKGSKTEVEYPANTIYGTPAKSGVYTVVATVTTAGKKTATCSQTIVVRKDGEKIVKAECDAEAGKVTGAGIYQTGKSATLKATANKGYVFAGWYEDESFDTPCDSSVTDYRNPGYAYTMGEADKMFYARFELVAADTNLNLMVDGVAVVPGENPLKSFTVGCATNISLAVESLSLPKISVKGLPDGLKFTDKPVYKKGSKTEIETPANSIYGTPTKPGVYKVSVSLTNTSIKKALVNDFEIVVPNLTDELIAVADEYGPYVPGVDYTNTVDVAAGCTVTGLPSGMKWTAKAVVDNKTKTEVIPANSFYGAPTKPGKYTVYFTKTVDKVKHTATATFIVGDFPIVNVVMIGTGTGKITGAGAFAANKKVTLKATADTKDDAKKCTKKSVFAGWYLDEDGNDPVESSVDYRTASLPYVMTADPEATLYAMFVTQEEDSDVWLYVEDREITADAADNNFVAEGTKVLRFELESISVPKATVSGLPAGMKFTDKALTVKATKTEEAYDVPANSIYGTPTKPGIYTVTVKLTNTTVKKAIEKKFTIEVPNLTAANGYFAEWLGNGIGEKHILSVGISNIDDFLPSLKLKRNVKLAVSSLPAGLKYDARTGTIIGVATKPGIYTVTLTVTDGKEKYVSTITVEVEALADWVVGTFRGCVETYGWGWSDICSFEVKVAANGGVSAKLIEPNPAWGSVTLKTGGLRRNSENEYVFVIWDGDYENGGEGSIGEVRIYKSDNGLGRLYAEEIGLDEDEDEFEAYWNGYQDVYSLALSEIPRLLFKTDNKRYFNIDEDGGVVLTFGAKGAVSVFEPGVVWGKSQLLPFEYDADNGVVVASLWLMGYDEWEDVTFGAELILSIPISQDGIAKASEIVVEDVVPGPNW